VVRDYTGHGVGPRCTKDPQVPICEPGKGVRLKQGMTLPWSRWSMRGSHEPACWMNLDGGDRRMAACRPILNTPLPLTDGEPDILTLL